MTIHVEFLLTAMGGASELQVKLGHVLSFFLVLKSEHPYYYNVLTQALKLQSKLRDNSVQSEPCDFIYKDAIEKSPKFFKILQLRVLLKILSRNLILHLSHPPSPPETLEYFLKIFSTCTVDLHKQNFNLILYTERLPDWILALHFFLLKMRLDAGFQRQVVQHAYYTKNISLVPGVFLEALAVIDDDLLMLYLELFNPSGDVDFFLDSEIYASFFQYIHFDPYLLYDWISSGHAHLISFMLRYTKRLISGSSLGISPLTVSSNGCLGKILKLHCQLSQLIKKLASKSIFLGPLLKKFDSLQKAVNFVRD